MTNIEQLMLMCKKLNFERKLAMQLMKTENLNMIVENTTLLYQAVENENIDMIRLLLENGANPNFFAEDDGPVLWELQYNDFFDMEDNQQLEIVKLLLDNDANPNIEWEDESLFEYILYKVFNETGYDDWDFVARFFIYLVAYGGSSECCRPKIYEEFDKRYLHEYKFCFLENGGRGEIIKSDKRVAYI